MIEVQNLSKTYKVAQKRPGFKGTLSHFFKRQTVEVHAVNQINFSIKPGEIVGFLGANGAGKTTTLKMLCGLIHPSSGEINVAGYVPQRLQTSFLKKISLVLGQKQQLIWDLPAMDSLRVNAAIYGIPNFEMNKRIKDLGEMLHIGDELKRPMRKLSLGQRMKMELMAALLHHPKVLFLDEPTLGLDINSQVRVRKFLAEYNKQTGATILLTSHYMADIKALCKRVILIHKGKLLHDGLLENLISQLSSSRRVHLELNQEISSTNSFQKYGIVESIQDRVVNLIVSKKDLTKNVAGLLADFDVNDLEVSELPIDQLIGELLDRGYIS